MWTVGKAWASAPGRWEPRRAMDRGEGALSQSYRHPLVATSGRRDWGVGRAGALAPQGGRYRTVMRGTRLMATQWGRSDQIWGVFESCPTWICWVIGCGWGSPGQQPSGSGGASGRQELFSARRGGGGEEGAMAESGQAATAKYHRLLFFFF